MASHYLTNWTNYFYTPLNSPFLYSIFSTFRLLSQVLGSSPLSSGEVRRLADMFREALVSWEHCNCRPDLSFEQDCICVCTLAPICHFYRIVFVCVLWPRFVMFTGLYLCPQAGELSQRRMSRRGLRAFFHYNLGVTSDVVLDRQQDQGPGAGPFYF